MRASVPLIFKESFSEERILNWIDYSHALLNKCKQKELPYHVCFELTPFCNFHCNMCYIRLNPRQAAKKGELLSTSQWIFLANAAKKMGALSMELTGGEALIRPDFNTLYNAFIDLGFLIILRSNGYSFNDDTLLLLKKKKPYKILITLYGATDETYQSVCGVANGFSIVSKNITMLRDAGFRIGLSTTITRENRSELGAMKTWANDNGFNLTVSGMLITPIEGTERTVNHLRFQEPNETFELTEEMKAIPRKVINKDFYLNPFWMCRSFGAKFTITWNGKMTMCNINPSIWSDPFKAGVETAYHELYSQLKAIKRPDKCMNCKYLDLCSVCPSMLYSGTGNMEQTNDDLCKYAHRKYKNQLLKSNTYNYIELIKDCDDGVLINEDKE